MRTFVPNPRPRTLRRRSLVTVGLLAALVIIGSAGALVEDAGNTWAAVYLTNSLDATPTIAGLGFVALVGLQFVGRLFGDRLMDRYGQRGGLFSPPIVGAIAGSSSLRMGLIVVPLAGILTLLASPVLPKRPGRRN